MSCMDKAYGFSLYCHWNKFNMDPDLTRPQEDVVKMLAMGMTYKQIAADKGISYRSVQDMLVRLYKKTNCKDRTDIVVWCIKKGLLEV